MSGTGVKVSDDVMTRFQDMKMGKKLRYMLMVIDGPLIVHKESQEKTDNQEEDFKNFISRLSDKVCCYAILDLTCESPSVLGAVGGTGKGKEVLFSISWCPDNGILKDKMVYAATINELKKKVKEGVKVVQANDFTDLEYEELMKLGKSN